MCCGTPRSLASSPIVRKACSLLRIGSAMQGLPGPGDPLAHDLAGAEGEDAAGCDRHFDAGLRIAANPLALVAQDEAAEARNLDVLPFGQSVAHMMENALDDPGRLGPGQPDFAVHDVSEIRAGERAHGRFPDRT